MEKLFTAIKEKCQRDRWYGPDLLSPREYDGAREDPHFDQQTLAMLDSNDPQHYGFAFPPASEADLVKTEEALGFVLPPLLRALYTTLANGGFGPGLGLRGAFQGYPGPYTTSDGSLLGSYPGGHPQSGNTHLMALQNLDNVTLLPRNEWPCHLLPICDVGCCIEICLGPDEQTSSVAPSEDNDQYVFARLGWTLEEWLWRWLKGANYCWP